MVIFLLLAIIFLLVFGVYAIDIAASLELTLFIIVAIGSLFLFGWSAVGDWWTANMNNPVFAKTFLVLFLFSWISVASLSVGFFIVGVCRFVVNSIRLREIYRDEREKLNTKDVLLRAVVGFVFVAGTLLSQYMHNK